MSPAKPQEQLGELDSAHWSQWQEKEGKCGYAEARECLLCWVQGSPSGGCTRRCSSLFPTFQSLECHWSLFLGNRSRFLSAAIPPCVALAPSKASGQNPGNSSSLNHPHPYAEEHQWICWLGQLRAGPGLALIQEIWLLPCHKKLHSPKEFCPHSSCPLQSCS